LGWQSGVGLALSGFPFFHIAGLFFNTNCIYLGWTQVLIPNPRDTDHICAEMEKYRPTNMANVPFWLTRSMSGVIFLIGFLIFCFNVIMTVKRAGRVRYQEGVA
jgi:cbb3-type cytochrome oxidase subunit 1